MLDIAIAGDWQLSAFLAGTIVLVAYWVLPKLVQGTPFFTLIRVLQPFALIMATVFGGIALFKLIRRQQRSMKHVVGGTGIPSAWDKGGHVLQRAPSDVSQSHSWGKYSVQDSAQGINPSKLDEAWKKLSEQSKPAEPPSEWSIELLQSIEWKRFEEVVAAYFREKGYECRTVRCGADGGIDATIYKDGQKLAIVQCKAWSNRLVGVKPVRELLGVMVHEKVNKGYFMTTNEYTAEALEFAKEKPILLVSGQALLRAILRMPEMEQQRLLAVATEGDYTTPTCPSCGIKLVKRDGSRGGFWGCSNYPRCRVKIGIKGND